MAMKDIIANMDYALSTCSRHDVIGDDLFWYSDSLEGCDCKEMTPEFHDQYVDIEVILKGREVIDCSESNHYETICDDRILDQDVAFVEGIKMKNSCHWVKEILLFFFLVMCIDLVIENRTRRFRKR